MSADLSSPAQQDNATTTKQNVVIVGGGPTGVHTARQLLAKLASDRQASSKYQVILVTARPIYFNLPGAIRMLVTAEGKLEDKIMMPYADALKVKGLQGEVKIGKVVSFTSGSDSSSEGGEVTLESGETISYSVLLLCPGSAWTSPLDFPDDEEGIHEHIRVWREKIAKAEKYLVVGGGAVGIGTSIHLTFPHGMGLINI